MDKIEERRQQRIKRINHIRMAIFAVVIILTVVVGMSIKSVLDLTIEQHQLKKENASLKEKKAALEVVQARLEKIGLAPFCLELHSNKVDKQHFLRQMQQAIDAVGAEAPEGYSGNVEILSKKYKLVYLLKIEDDMIYFTTSNGGKIQSIKLPPE